MHQASGNLHVHMYMYICIRICTSVYKYVYGAMTFYSRYTHVQDNEKIIGKYAAETVFKIADLQIC